MIMISNNILRTFRDGEKYQICLKFDGEHDYESTHLQYISKNIIEVEYVCLECGNLKYVYYNYLEDSYD